MIDGRPTARIPSSGNSPIHVKTPATSFGFATASKRRTAPNRLESPPAIRGVPRHPVRR
ncbi:hypothetical protein OE88DRAFT_1669207 [Heliocybe sulcata]|uniref:Uncharacterized protein n=1 Tax=Heliocybe sulcata TaxID=5364 RepID=A0A5C3MJA0_9AGAM|nr:hypothetical protein OE88DRAFT_1669207 [Heliocybe sulcata]